MSDHPRYRIVASTANALIIKDVGPHTKHLTITNDPEWVVMDLQHRYMERIVFQANGQLKVLLYIDSQHELSQMIMEDRGGYARFVSFRGLGVLMNL